MEKGNTIGKLLIVEDEKDKRQGLVRIFMYDGNWPGNLIKDVGSSIEAIKAIEEFEPEVVILDLKIPREKNDEPRIENAASVLREIEYFNSKNPETIYVIIISASVNDSGIQSLIKEDRSKIISFIDKNEAAIDSDKFKEKLLQQVHKALTRGPEEKIVTYSSIRKSSIKELKELNPSLWEKIDKYILREFELLFQKDINVDPRAKQIIGTCGEVVEDIIFLISERGYTISPRNYKDYNPSVGERLFKYTGRERDKDSKQLILTGEKPLLSRASAEFAFQAYKYRSEALHSKENDIKNDKIFKGRLFTKEDAAISINLIMPLVLEYIKLLQKKPL